jgi:ATP-binding cassette subfamily B protein
MNDINSEANMKSWKICSDAGFYNFIDPGIIKDKLIGREFGGMEISGGEQQRLAIARAFFRDMAKIIILDEPAASLDPVIEAEIYNNFLKLTRNKTTIMITHRMGSVTRMDKILVMEKGVIIEYGSHDELMGLGGEYRRMFNLQAGQYRN